MLFNHWGGKEFHEQAKDFAKNFKERHPEEDKSSTPFTRLEPETIMVAFIQSLTAENYSLYLGKDQNDGDNSDAGHSTIDLEKL